MSIEERIISAALLEEAFSAGPSSNEREKLFALSRMKMTRQPSLALNKHRDASMCLKGPISLSYLP